MRRLLIVSALLAVSPALASAQDMAQCDDVFNNTDTAMAVCTQLIEGGTLSGQDLGRAYHNRGIGYHLKRDLANAIADYDRAILNDATVAVAFANRGLAYSDMNDASRAIPDFDRAISLDPNNVANFRNRGYAYLQKGGLWNAGSVTLETLPALFYVERAIADFTQAIKMTPDDANSFYNRGLAHAFLGNREAAIADMRETLRINPQFEQAKQVLQSLGEQP
jgi:tetratricopeptide (TPR) repeat protein